MPHTSSAPFEALRSRLGGCCLLKTDPDGDSGSCLPARLRSKAFRGVIQAGRAQEQECDHLIKVTIRRQGPIEEPRLLFVFLTGGPYTSWRPQKHFAGVATRGHEWCCTPQCGAKLKVPRHTCYYSFISLGSLQQPRTIHYPKRFMDLEKRKRKKEKARCWREPIDRLVTNSKKVPVKGNVKNIESNINIVPVLELH